MGSEVYYRIEGAATEEVRKLYTLVERQALRTDEKLDDVLSELRRL